jgi:dihydropteroate synthase
VESLITRLSEYGFEKELLSVGIHAASKKIFMDKHEIIPLKLYNVKAPAANIIKQELLGLGGDCAVNKNCVTCKIDISDIIMLGTRKQYRGLIKKLKLMNFFGINEISKELENFLNGIAELNTVLADGRKIVYDKMKIMGIINSTPDSFYENSRKNDIIKGVEAADKMIKAGADILDIGGESTRPGSDPVSAEEEISRVVPLIKAIKSEFKQVVISIDTYRAQTALKAIEAGADIVNDISAMTFDDGMAKVVKDNDAPVILMHVNGKPKNMQAAPNYDNLMREVLWYFKERIEYAENMGIKREKLILDPGIGFGKRLEHNLELMQKIAQLKNFNLPVLLAASRKSSIGKVLNDLPPEERLEGTIATTCIAVSAGLQMVRVHDVCENARAARMMEAVLLCQ